MLKKAIITGISGSSTRVSILNDDCADSSTCSECGLCGKNGASREPVTLNVDSIDGISIGDTVELDVVTPRGSLIALVLYMLPLILMFAGGSLGNAVYSSTGMVIGGILGFSAAVLLIFILNKSLLRVRGRIIKKI